VAVSLLDAWAVVHVAAWYVPRLGITFMEAFGASIILGILAQQYVPRGAHETQAEQYTAGLSAGLMRPLVFLSIAWLGRFVLL